ncbi:DNA internalization-related competence protein ComEC/Rec2 [Echinimonas agarilytica]|uniref:DNA internalization-related competence protein ComEC/Rec2 n=1 Tax=Echinimonas agarilytica TaxID=1215918 RepID=A0AA42B7N5_9GAMM|nr:DNA internalization-related competence protein ComEC/Rec2 [Echinimonas agarilytica]MCM2679942.1 DNA internalization-related competence protein ComEC/Rec2 [Echinimonas agarilytica]
MPTESEIILCAAVACICLFRKRIRFLSAVFLGIVIIGFHGHTYQNAVTEIDSRLSPLSITLVSVKRGGEHQSTRVIATVEGLPSRYRIRLNWKDTLAPPHMGQSWQVVAKTKPPHDLSNPGGFNYRRYLLSNNIVASGYVTSATLRHDREHRESFVTSNLRTVKYALEQHSSSALMLAMALGDRSEMTPQLWQTLANTGTAHLMAISGLHLGILFTLVVFVLRGLVSVGRYLGWIRYARPTVFVWWLALAVCAVYTVVTGMAVPTVRALLFAGVVTTMLQLHIRIRPFRLVLLVAAALLIIAPNMAYSTSFWLSFSAVNAVFVGIWVSQSCGWRRWRALVCVQCAVVVCLLPIQLGVFGQQSLLAPLINLVAIPWISLSILPMIFAGAVLSLFLPIIGYWCFFAADWQLDMLMVGLTYMGALEWQILYSDVIGAWMLFCVGLLVVMSMMVSKAHTIGAMVLLVAVLGGQYFRNFQTAFTVEFIDVGQGQSVLVREGFDVVLYDVGAAFKSGFNMADQAVIPYLRNIGVSTIDSLILSHSDNDHAGSEAHLRKVYPVAERWQSWPSSDSGKLCKPPLTIATERLHGYFLSPSVIGDSDNDNSCVLKIESSDTQVLLTGDISRKQEKNLMQQWPREVLEADVMSVPHHGSGTSSSVSFIQRVNPQIAVVSSGHRNRWRFPRAEVSRRYQNHAVELLNTAQLGLVKLQWNEDRWNSEGYCDLTWPVWYRCADPMQDHD